MSAIGHDELERLLWRLNALDERTLAVAKNVAALVEERIGTELEAARDAIRKTPLHLDCMGYPMEKGAFEWMELPAVRKAIGKEPIDQD